MKITPKILAGSLFALLILSSLPIRAAAVVWNSTTDGNWSSATNWNPQSVPGLEPTNLDQVTFGSEGFATTTRETRTVTVNEDYTVNRISFANTTAPQNYILQGTGTLTLDGSSIAAFLNFGNTPTGAANAMDQHEIRTNLNIIGTLSISVSGNGNGRYPVISGNISSNSLSPIILDVTGGGGNTARVNLLGNNNFHGGEIRMSNNNGLVLAANSARGATIRMMGSDGSGNTKNLTLSMTASTTFDFTRMIVESSGRIDTGTPNAGAIVNWQSIEIADAKALEIYRGVNTSFRVDGAGKVVSLGKNSELRIVQANGTRGLAFYVGDGALLEGEGKLITRRENTGSHGLYIDNGGVMDPGQGAGNTGILRIGDVGSSATQVEMLAGSTLRMQINGVTTGTGYDQVAVDYGVFALTESGAGVTLDLLVGTGFAYSESTTMTLVSVAAGASFSGSFVDLQGNRISQGDELYLGDASGLEWYARISYTGANGSVLLYDFSTIPVPEPTGAGLIILGLGALLAMRSRRQR